MTTTNRAKTSRHGGRATELRMMLQSRRRELANEVQGRIRNARTDNSMERDVLDEVDCSEINIQDEIEFRLTQIKTETLKRVESALHRIQIGIYGNCTECGDEMADARLRALPFAARCKDCEEARESDELRTRAERRGSRAPLFDLHR